MKDAKCVSTGFLTIQGGCYAAFLFLDMTGGSIRLSTGIKFSIILFCFLYALLRRGGNGIRDLFLVRSALFFTLVSDFIILFLPAEAYIFGVGSFLIVQQLYGIRLRGIDNLRRGIPEKNGFLGSFLLRLTTELVITLIVLLGLFIAEVRADSLLFTSVLYFVCLVHNVVTAIRLANLKPRVISDIIFAVGLVLFLLCDINVGLFNLSGFIPFTGKTAELIYRMATILMWTFYAPSQVMIVLSADRYPSKITKNCKKIM